MTEQDMKLDARITALELLVTQLCAAEFKRMALGPAAVDQKVQEIPDGPRSLEVP